MSHRSEWLSGVWSRSLIAALGVAILISSSAMTATPASAAQVGSPAQRPSPAPSLGVNGPAVGQITAHDGKFWLGDKPIVLKGVGVTSSNGHQDKFPLFGSWGMNHLRMRVQWPFLEPTPPTKDQDGVWTHTYDSDFIDTLKSAIALAAQNGLYVTINLGGCTDENVDCSYFKLPAWLYTAPYNSHKTTYAETEAGKLQAQTDFWTDDLRQEFFDAAFLHLVKEIKSLEGIVGYEIFNEPDIGNLSRTHETTQLILDWQLGVAKKIRANDAPRVIAFTTRAGAGIGLPAADLSGWRELGNVSFDAHDYYGARWGWGMDINGDDGGYGEDLGPLYAHLTGDVPYIGTTLGQIRWLQKRMEYLQDIPLWIGEVGDNPEDPGVTRYWATALGAMNYLGVSWVADSGPWGFIKPDGSLEDWGQIVVDAVNAGRRGASDDFTRSASDGWGTATSGQTWTTVGGPASDYAVNGSAGTMTVPTANSSRLAYLPMSTTDQEVLVQVSLNRLPTTMRVSPSALGRYDPASGSFYSVRAGFVWDGSVRIDATKKPGIGVETLLGTEVNLGQIAAADTWFWLRARFVDAGSGVRLLGRVWEAGSPEPTTWQFSYLDEAAPLMGAGSAGLRTVALATDTPFVASFDDFLGRSRQRPHSMP